MIQRESAINLLQELVDKLKAGQFRLPTETQILNEEMQISKDVLFAWKGKVDALVRELCIKWLSEEMNLETVMQLWMNSLAEDQDFLEAFKELGDIIMDWKSKLRIIFAKDESLFLMPTNANVEENPEEKVLSLESESNESISDNN